MEYRGLTLDRFQEDAIHSLKNGRSVLVSAPTGTGKTLIADWIVEQALGAGKQVIYTAPIKALSNQKFRDYTRLYGDAKVGLVTGDLVIRRDAPCVVMTTEILRNMLLGGEKLENLMAVIVDEIHFLDDKDRGTTWEELLIYLPKHVQVVGLSATLSNLKQFADWVSFVRDGPVDVVTEQQRSVPLQFSYLSVDTALANPQRYREIYKRKGRSSGAAKFGKQNRGGSGGRRRRPQRKTTHIHVFKELQRFDLLPYLYFVFSRRDTERLARSLGEQVRHSLLDDPEQQMALNDALDEAAGNLGPALAPDLRALYGRGIAFHHAGLHVQLKALVEDLYERKLVKVLYCTSTFALGINMPARTVVFDGLSKYNGTTMAPLTTRQFMQKAGRAGRRGLDEVGHVVIRMDFTEFPENGPLLEKYARHDYEPVRSSFSLSFNSIVNLLESHNLDQVREVVDKSFLNWNLSGKAKVHLEKAGSIEDKARNNRDRKEADKLRRRAAKAEGRCWSEFEKKLGYLQQAGYLQDDLTFNAGATVLANIQISEIMMTELILSGELESLAPNYLFGVLCSITNELSRHVHHNFRPNKMDKQVAGMVRKVRESMLVTEAELMNGARQDFDPELIIIGRHWAEGDSLQELLMMVNSDTDISGDLITGFRRAKDLVGQLRDVYRDQTERVQMLNALIHSVRRDEVEVVD